MAVVQLLDPDSEVLDPCAVGVLVGTTTDTGEGLTVDFGVGVGVLVGLGLGLGMITIVGLGVVGFGVEIGPLH